ncbi:MAG: sulfite exporter TauE/SafE family protein [Pirellulaceae bacterium]
MPELTSLQWCLVVLAAFGVGVSKSGFTGVGLFHVSVFATLFGARESTGIVLPMLIVGDVLAVSVFRQHARWDYVRRLLLPTTIGVVVGWLLMYQLDERVYKPTIGAIILTLATMQFLRIWRPRWFGQVPHSLLFAWGLGWLTGFSTMLANAAGPVMALYLVAVSLPKLQLIGTTAWFFLILNLFKVPFSISLGLIHTETLLLNAVLVPGIVLGLYSGRWLMQRVPQRAFDALVLAFSVVMGLRLVGLFGH